MKIADSYSFNLSLTDIRFDMVSDWLDLQKFESERCNFQILFLNFISDLKMLHKIKETLPTTGVNIFNLEFKKPGNKTKIVSIR